MDIKVNIINNGGGRSRSTTTTTTTTNSSSNSSYNNNSSSDEQDHDQEMNNSDLRRGPWTVEEDLTLINYIAIHGEGRWNSLARCAGLKRTGKSCRLRWLNYLRPDVRRGNITLEEQLLILELHSRWGNSSTTTTTTDHLDQCMDPSDENLWDAEDIWLLQQAHFNINGN
ncbi:hypothetical protein F8388_012851 [Cannabis sativa]|uniref:Uncharacterized protein n=1 Tax=Cannabis sativa TaxID=3483 RepID=A0A7J6FKZ8_CANSA|nr:hypothetical protein F8388_012851 [Cannabis sativa]KAF4371382.1 hypothetical protein G4B88_003852 [Cannabis sativa]